MRLDNQRPSDNVEDQRGAGGGFGGGGGSSGLGGGGGLGGGLIGLLPLLLRGLGMRGIIILAIVITIVHLFNSRAAEFLFFTSDEFFFQRLQRW